jgi:hypothetical protein
MEVFISMENYMPNPNVPPYVAPAAVNPALPMYPVNINAGYEEVNIYGPNKPYHHHHHHGVYGAWTSTGAILVLFILLVIVLRSLHRC